MKTEFVERAFRLFVDASFVRNNFVQTAFAEKRWNIAVYEAHRVSELLIRSMIYYLGHEPDRTRGHGHDLARHINDLQNYLSNAGQTYIAFTAGFYTDSNDGYCVTIEGKPTKVAVFRIDYPVFTQLGMAIAVDLSATEPGNLKFEGEPPEMRIYLDNRCIGRYTDSTYTGPLTIKNNFTQQPTASTLRHLRKIGGRLYKKRGPAFYSEEQYDESDAQQARSDMEGCVKLLEGFFSFELAPIIVSQREQ